MSFSFNYKKYNQLTELSKEIQKLILQADIQLGYAYAPYSNFYVGAALLTDDGKLYTGCNQENASYPLCMCAERVALYNIGATEKSFKIKALAITAYNPAKALPDPCMPCGACRQVLQEFEQRQGSPIPLYLTAKESYIIELPGISELLPASFSKDHLL